MPVSNLNTHPLDRFTLSPSSDTISPFAQMHFTVWYSDKRAISLCKCPKCISDFSEMPNRWHITRHASRIPTHLTASPCHRPVTPFHRTGNTTPMEIFFYRVSAVFSHAIPNQGAEYHEKKTHQEAQTPPPTRGDTLSRLRCCAILSVRRQHLQAHWLSLPGMRA